MSKYVVTFKKAVNYIDSLVNAKGKGSRKKKKLGLKLYEHYWKHRRNATLFTVAGSRPKAYLKKCDIFNKRSTYLFRDEYGELNLHKCPYSSTPIYPPLYVKQARQLELAQIKVAQLVADKKIPAEFHGRDKKGRGESINHSIYGIARGLVLFQVREWKKQYKNYWPDKIIKYYLTDGKDLFEITSGRNLIRKSVGADDSMSAPLRAIKKFLPEKWAIKIKGKDIDWKKTRKEVEVMKGYKAVLKRNGKFYSIWSELQHHMNGRTQSFEWPVNKWMKQKIKWYRDFMYSSSEHPENGLYFYTNIHSVRNFVNNMEDHFIESIKGRVYIFECEAKYTQKVSSTKHVASHLRLIGEPVLYI